jgi:predicted nucleic acid-binding protein
MFLLDTNVISELRKARSGKAHPNVVSWAESVDIEFQYISVISIMEIEQGILQISRRDSKQGDKLLHWLETQILKHFKQRILSVDLLTARTCANLHVPDPRPERDALIAATGIANNLTVVTRNTIDFEPMNVKILNPWL